jgi:2-oxoglutarate dehydrogenase E2 component (dihydrolipoamide succinyltransferase)
LPGGMRPSKSAPLVTIGDGTGLSDSAPEAPVEAAPTSSPCSSGGGSAYLRGAASARRSRSARRPQRPSSACRRSARRRSARCLPPDAPAPAAPHPPPQRPPPAPAAPVPAAPAPAALHLPPLRRSRHRSPMHRWQWNQWPKCRQQSAPAWETRNMPLPAAQRLLTDRPAPRGRGTRRRSTAAAPGHWSLFCATRSQIGGRGTRSTRTRDMSPLVRKLCPRKKGIDLSTVASDPESEGASARRTCFTAATETAEAPVGAAPASVPATALETSILRGIELFRCPDFCKVIAERAVISMQSSAQLTSVVEGGCHQSPTQVTPAGSGVLSTTAKSCRSCLLRSGAPRPSRSSTRRSTATRSKTAGEHLYRRRH